MATAEAHACGAGLLALPEVFETDADGAVRADRDGRSLFLGGGTDVAVHGDPPLAHTIADSPYAHYRRRSIPLPRGCLRHSAAHQNADSSLRSRRRLVLKLH